MPLPVPQLDNIDFAELTEFARGLIPRFATDWTDHNLHDPGMTLIDLLCWIVDQQVYEVGFVSDRHILAFGALLGIHPQRARASRGLVWPLESEALNGAPVQVNYELARGAAVSSLEVPDLEFVLRRALFITSARPLSAPPQGDGNLIYAAQRDRKEPIVIERNGDPLVLALDRPLAMPADEPTAPISLGIELEAAGMRGDERTEPIGSLTLDYLLEAPGEAWRRLDIVDDETQALNRSGVITFRVPPTPVGTPPETPSRLRINIDDRLNPLAPRLRSIALNVLPVEQIQRVASAPFGASNGLPDQAFELDTTGLLEAVVPVKVDADKWESIASLASAGPDDPRYEFRHDENQVLFGNGLNGAIPAAGAQIIHGDYSLTAGAAGNVAPGFKWSVAGAALPDGQENYGINRRPFSGGSDADDVERLKPRIRARALKRLAMSTDMQLADAAEALDFLSVDRAEVLDRYNPNLAGADVPGSRTLVVVPKRDPATDATADVADRYVTAVRRALVDRRVLGERLTVISPERVVIRVRASLVIADGDVPEKILDDARARLDARLTDVRQHEDVDPWPTGRPVTLTEIRTVLAQSPGVIAVSACELAQGKQPFAARDIALSRIAIAIGGAHELDATCLRTGSMLP